MMRLVGPLTHVGASVRRASRFEPLRGLLLVAAVFAFILSLAAVAATVATYSGWDARARDRSPRPVDVDGGEPARLLWASTFELMPDDAQFQLIYIAALTADAPVPPGLDTWPGVGDVVLSPALADGLGVATGDETRYGTVVATIGSDGLVEAHELLAYVGADGRLAEGQRAVRPASGFGTPWVEFIGATFERTSIGVFLSLVTALLVAPSTWLLVNAVRIGGGARARRVHIAGLLGAGRGPIRSLIWGEARGPWAVGVVLASSAVAIALLRDVELPYVSFTLLASDLRAEFPVVAGAVALGALVSALAVRSVIGLRSERPYRDAGVSTSLTWVRGAACPVVAAIAVTTRNLALGVGNVELAQMLAILGPALALALLPMGTVVWVTLAARWARERARRTGDPAALTGSAQLAARPRPAARFGATAAILIAVTAVGANVLVNIVARNAVEASQLQAALGRHVAVVQPFAQIDGSAWDAAVEALRAQYVVAELREDGGATTLVGEAQSDLDEFVSGRSSDGQAAWLDFLAGPDVTATVGDLASNEATVLLVTPRTGGDIDIEQLRDVLGASTAPMWTARLPGGEWVSGAVQAVRDARWLTWLGGLCLTISLIALWASYSNELRRAIRSLYAVQVLAPSPAFVRRTLAWRIVAPVTVAVAGGSALAISLSIPRSISGYSEIPYGFIAVCAAGALLTGVIAWHVTWRVCVRSAETMSFAPPDE